MSGTEPHDIVPEGFDLDDARRQWSATDNDDRRHCPNPNCHSMSISARAPDHSSHKGKPGYRCVKCGAEFDEPIRHENADNWRGGRND